MPAADMGGLVFGRLTVGGRAPNKGKETAWHCTCSCGEVAIVGGGHLRSGATKSCGCLHREAAALRLLTHGLCGHPLYRTWYGMKERCYNSSHSNYSYYGGRGIAVCSEWQDSFETFSRDMGEKPTPAHSIDRINNELGYSKENCRWATKTEQVLNRRQQKSKSGVVGVTVVALKSGEVRYRANSKHARKQFYHGLYKTLPEAITARDSFRQQKQAQSVA